MVEYFMVLVVILLTKYYLEKNISFTTQTQMNKAPFQNLNAVSALTEISDETAATCSGGETAVTLYNIRQSINYMGKQQCITPIC